MLFFLESFYRIADSWTFILNLAWEDDSEFVCEGVIILT